MEILKRFIETAKSNPQRIVLPEGDEPRTLKAADRIIGDGIAKIILLGQSDKILALAKENGLKNIERATIIDPQKSADAERYTDLLFELRKNKGLTREQAVELVKDPLYFGCLMIKSGDADGELAGARNTTGNVLRPALQIVKTQPGISVISGAMLMFCKEKAYGEDGFLLVADVAVMPNPTAQELAQIAVCTGRTMKNMIGIEPKVAMLSFSTKGSAQHEFVDRVVEATGMAQQMAPELKIDGELQADAALVPSVGKFKAPGSPVAGEANVLVFPALEIGNIAYKMVERLGGAVSVGPVLQGMAAPINDLSRGCSVDDIYYMTAITANQAITAKKQ
ncbi:MAG: phosphate acetyltransferase [Bacteroidetes bacterium]|jgi:phosphate acetyltransferase|nr:phosphate acetyltransferase [Bacteroidetes oral taxon 274 str. F0058]RKV88132.1 MAG: phosphate acetyltransferase [Bacteroidota bacterium]